MKEVRTGVYDFGIENLGAPIRDADGNIIQTRSRVFNDSILNQADGADMLQRLSEDMGLRTSTVRIGTNSIALRQARDKEYWRERLAEINAGRSEDQQLAEDTFDQFAGRSGVTANMVAEASESYIFTNVGGQTRFAVASEVDALLSDMKGRAQGYAEAMNIDPTKIEMTADRTGLAAKIVEQFNRSVSKREASHISNNQVTAGSATARAIDEAIRSIDPNLEGEELAIIRSLVSNSIRGSRPELSEGIENITFTPDLGTTHLDAKDAMRILDTGRAAFRRGLLDSEDPLLAKAVELGGFNQLSSVERGALMRKYGTQEGMDKIDRITSRSNIDQESYARIVSATNERNKMMAEGMSEAEANDAVLAKHSDLAPDLIDMGIAPADAFSLVGNALTSKDVDMPDRYRKRIERANDKLMDWYSTMTEEEFIKAYDESGMDSWLTNGADMYKFMSKSILAEDDVQLRNQVAALATVGSAQSEGRGEAAVVSVNDAQRETDNQLLSAMLVGIQSDISRLGDSVIQSNARVLRESRP